MTIGLIFFTLADSHVQPEFDFLGNLIRLQEFYLIVQYIDT
jgi:hypothetical protein